MNFHSSFSLDKVHWTDNDLKAFRYFCRNSPKLADICIDIQSCLDWESVAKSIGPLVSRSALRTLTIKCGNNYDYNEVANESIMNLLKCPVEKPKLEHLILSPTSPLSSIYELVKENFNLKSLTINMEQLVYYTQPFKTPREETIDDLIRIFNCNNGLDEIDLGRYGLDFLVKDKRLQKINRGPYNGRIYRDDFASMATILADFLSGDLDQDSWTDDSSWTDKSWTDDSGP